MNKKILSVLALGWLVAGCASQPPADGDIFGERGTISVPGCMPYVGPVVPCSGDENDAKLLIDLDTFDLVPKCVNVKKGKSLKITLVSETELKKGTVVIFPKDPQNYPWLARANDPSKNKIKIKVPKNRKSGDPLPEGIYNYGISYNGKCLDPRVNVKN